jgi:hypothetical protein
MENDNLNDYTKQIEETFGPANKCFGKEIRLNFPANDLDNFLSNLYLYKENLNYLINLYHSLEFIWSPYII